jgi:hypothetical protein
MTKLEQNELLATYTVTKDGKVFNSKGQKLTGSEVTGYRSIRVGGRNGFWKLIHRWVAELYIPNPENKPEVNHKDGNKQNNKVSNLEWVTPSENMLHAYETKLNYCSTSKLTLSDARSIRKRYVPRCNIHGQRAMAREFNVTLPVIQLILKNKTYREDGHHKITASN